MRDSKENKYIFLKMREGMFSVIESIATTAPLACVWCCARFKGFSQLIGINTHATYVKKAVAVSMRGPVTDQRSSLHSWELVLQPCTPKEHSGIRIKQTKFVPWVPPLFFLIWIFILNSFWAYREVAKDAMNFFVYSSLRVFECYHSATSASPLQLTERPRPDYQALCVRSSPWNLFLTCTV